MESKRPLSAAILVGGASSRMGRPKALLELAGRTFVQHVYAVVSSVADQVVLAGSGAVPPALTGLARVQDVPGVAGPLAGVLAAIRSQPDADWLVAACDMPLMSAAAVEWLVGCRAAGCIAVMARRADWRIEPLPGIFSPAAAELLESLAAGTGALHSLASDPRVCTPTIPEEFRACWRNINEPGEFAALSRDDDSRDRGRISS